MTMPLEKDYEKDDLLWDWITNCGRGVMGFEFGNIPQECLDFCISQYNRFNVPMPPELYQVIEAGASATFYTVDSVDPYVIFKGIGDVDITSEWCEFAYQIHCSEGTNTSKEANPEQLETYVFVPGQAEACFNEMMGRPGLEALPWNIGELLADVLEGRSEECWDAITGDTERLLRTLCTPAGASQPDKQRMMAYFELAAWASFVWLVGPLGRGYLKDRHPIVDTVLEHGECVLYEWTVVPPTYYTRHARRPESCHRCGTQAWCVETTQILGATTFICEACLNFDLPKFGIANCGTKFCKQSLCPNHPYAQQGAAGAFTAMSQAGQLQGLAAGKGQMRLHGFRGPQLSLS